MGFAAGFQVGAQAVERGIKIREEDELKRNLAQAFAKPEEFVDYTPEQVKQIQGLQAAGGYDVQAVPGADGQAPTLRYTAKPQSMYYDDAGQPEAPIEIAPQRVQRYGGKTVAGQFNPTELRGLQMREAARALGASGDVRGAALLEAQAEEQEFQAKYRPLQLQQLQGSIAGQDQQRELTGLDIKQRKRTETEQENYTNFSNFAAANPNATADELKKAAFEQFKFTPKQWKDAVNTRLGIKEDEQKEFVLNIKNKLKGKNLQQLGSLYNSDPDFDDKTDLAIVPGKNGAVTLNFIDKGTKKITSSQTFTNEALATEYLNKQATEPETIGSWMISLREKEASIAAKDASTLKDRSMAGAYAQGGKGSLKQKISDFKEVFGREPTEAEKGVLAGLTNKPREVTQSEVTARARLLIDSGATDPDDPTKPLSPEKAIQMATSQLSGVPYVSPVDDLIAQMARARGGANPTPGQPTPPAPPASTPTAPRQVGSAGIDPSRRNADIDPVTGLPRAAAPVNVPNVAQAVSTGLNAAQANYVDYLKGKIAANKPLTPDEAMRAKRYGLQ